MRETVLSTTRKKPYHVYMEKTLPTPATAYTVTERASKRYNTVVDVFDYGVKNECVTPLDLALSQTPNINPDQLVLVPAAGIGTYVLAAIIKGATPSNIVAVELNFAYCDLGDGIFGVLGVTYVNTDFLTYRPDMKFDVIIGNPPYQNGKNSQFYAKFLQAAERLLKDGGYFSLLTPSKASLPSSKSAPILKALGWNTVEFNMESFFTSQGQTIAKYSGVKGSTSESVAVICNGELKKFPTGSVFPVHEVDFTAIGILQKFFSHSKKLGWVKLKEEPKGNYVYTARVAKGFSETRPKGGKYAFVSHVNKCDEYFDGRFLSCKSKKQAEQYQWLLRQSRLYRFAVYCCTRAKFVPPLFWQLTPDLVEFTSNEELYNAVGLTPKEVDYITEWNKLND